MIEKDFQMIKLDVFHASHILELKTMEQIVLPTHATPTKLQLFRVLVRHVQVILDQINSEEDVMHLLIVMLEKDFQIIHVFLVRRIQELRVVMLFVQQIHVQIITELTLMERVNSVNPLLFSIFREELALNQYAMEDPFLKEMELVESVHNTHLPMMLGEAV